MLWLASSDSSNDNNNITKWLLQHLYEVFDAELKVAAHDMYDQAVSDAWKAFFLAIATTHGDE